LVPVSNGVLDCTQAASRHAAGRASAIKQMRLNEAAGAAVKGRSQ
jgi:hypothetical protein